MKKRKAFFRFEASSSIGAGHAIRSSVIADALMNRGWECQVVSSKETFNFIKNLKKYKRIDPVEFDQLYEEFDLLVIDHYGLDESYENKFREVAKKILVIDDLANRSHQCDVLLDQAFDRLPSDYRGLVPSNCKVLTGINYALVREELRLLRPLAVEKRRNTKEINRILISVGGSDPDNYTMKVLKDVLEIEFKGAIDIVLGFDPVYFNEIYDYTKKLKNNCLIHLDADIPKLTYEADLAIGASGSSVWERLCLGLPQYLLVKAKNQMKNFQFLQKYNSSKTLSDFLNTVNSNDYIDIVDGFGVNRLIGKLEDVYNDDIDVSFRRVQKEDANLIFNWQQLKDVRKYFNNPAPPTIREHNSWFSQRLLQVENPYWIILNRGKECGVISMTYSPSLGSYEISWFIIPEYQGCGIGTKSLKIAVQIVSPFKVIATVNPDNTASQRVFKKIGFLKKSEKTYVFSQKEIS